jgi:hypothetical protein
VGSSPVPSRDGEGMNSRAPACLVQGFFFQYRDTLGFGIAPGEGVVSVIWTGTVRDMFSGIIRQDECTGEWQGNFTDPFGDSTIVVEHLDDSTFTFVKRYHNRPDLIHYKLTWNGKYWQGTYSGERTGDGGASCILTPVPEGMLRG